jgi:hypothetical protein
MDGWARVRWETAAVAEKSPLQIQQSWLRRAGALLRYHTGQSANPAYRSLLAEAGVDPACPREWSQVPVIDKHWLARAGYDRQPACPGPVLIMGTSGSTAAQVLVPVTARSANRGLGDNFLRALVMSGVGPGQRHWGIEHRPDGQAHGETGSSISMTWLARHCGDNALVTVATDPLAEQLRRAAAFAPDTISGSPGFLQQVAREADGLCPRLLMYGGAALAGSDAGRLRARFPEARLAAFYPTTDAGALGVAAGGFAAQGFAAQGFAAQHDGIYRTFSETHFIEVLDADGQHVPAGSRGDVVVTQFGARAAPIIRYRVGDRATYRGWAEGRLLLSGIERAAEAAIGSTLVPYRDLQTWAPRLAVHDPSVVAVQLVRVYSLDDQREQPVVRVIGGAGRAELAARALALLDEFPQIAGEVASGELAPPRVEFRDPPATLAGHWKIPYYVDERAQCRND